MVSLAFILIAVFLLLLNAFFVLAEFASVKVRSTQIEVLEEQFPRQGKILRHVHEHLDEYLSVCQLGITFTSIGLGFVGEPALADLIDAVLGHEVVSHAVSLTISYIVISFLHILLGELVPKSIAIRLPERSALLTAEPLRLLRLLFYPALFLMNTSANAILRLFRLPPLSRDTAPSEAEVRIILERSQQEGLMSFRRLLLMENVFDFDEVSVRDIMQPLDKVAALRADRPWTENGEILGKYRFSRYPILEGDPPKVIGVAHVKDLLYRDLDWKQPIDLRAIARPVITTNPERSLEILFSDMRRRRQQIAMVANAQGQLLGMVTMEDILEQLVGAIEDEFEQAPSARLTDAVTESRIVVDLKAQKPTDAIREIVGQAKTDDLPVPKDKLIDALIQRELSLSTYLGHGIAVPHARLEGIQTPCMLFGRSFKGVKYGEKANELAHVFFVLLTPTSQPRAQVRLLARIAELRESSYVWDRLMEAKNQAEVLDAIRSADEVVVT
jgi:CBS domain containing-hemolysin-like protein/mannitol/fructose-specific phosphotransferase system IIA component